ncbi:MAG: GTP cyclohydrolase II [Anaerolineales bacterium]|nr:GTP cyclohydrolase II [Anaerolineales bacterium]
MQSVEPDSVASLELQRTTCARIPTPEGSFRLCHYTNTLDNKEHLALVMGDVVGGEAILVRVHSECMTGDVFGSLRCDCGEQLHAAMRAIAAAGRGVILYLRQEGRGIGLGAKLRAYNLQDEGYDTVDANLVLGHQADEREYWAAAGILADLNVQSIRLLTNNPAKIEHLRELGIRVVERVPVESSVHAENAAYLETKVRRMRHLLQLPAVAPPTLDGAYLLSELAQKVESVRDRARVYSAERGLPFVTISYAQSLDGSIAAATGKPLTLSGRTAMTVTHALRAVHDAILVGVGTVIADDPRLTVRLVAGPDPQPVVLDSQLRLPPNAQVLNHPRGAWIAATVPLHGAPAPGATMLKVAADRAQRVDLVDLLRVLAGHGIRSVMVEGGRQVLSSFIEQRLANFAVVTIAPRFVGGLQAMSIPPRNGSGPALPHLANVEYVPAGADLMVWGDVEWAA